MGKKVPMRIKAFFLGLLFIFLFGCAASVIHYLQYDIVLEEVERPPEAKERYRGHEISTAEEEGYKYIFEDEMIRILWMASPTELRFRLQNKTDHSIKIIWNDATYVCEKGKSHRVMHAGVKYINRNNPQQSSIVAGKGSITDFIYPADYANYTYDRWVERPLQAGGWIVKPLLPYSQAGGDPQKLLNNATSYIDKTIQVLLPIKLEEVTYNYIFTFLVKDVHLAAT
ncbi:MAG: hypothetical protein GTN73_03535 [Candidatus Aminicenantes bacterium]|nr:hypothetical protein [Candidatus Aminicenantes bacterium]